MHAQRTLLTSALLFGSFLTFAPTSHALTDLQKTVLNHLVKHRLMSELCDRAPEEDYYAAVIEKHALSDDLWTNEEAAREGGYFNARVLRGKLQYDQRTVDAARWKRSCDAYFDTLTTYD